MRSSRTSSPSASSGCRPTSAWTRARPSRTCRRARDNRRPWAGEDEGDMKGRIAVLKAYGGEFELREYPVPDVEPGAILVKLTRAGICGSDLHIWRGEMKEVYGALPQDLTFGHEMCG